MQNDFPYKDLQVVNCLCWYDGPILTHYSNEYEDNFLYMWVDGTDSSNGTVHLLFKVENDVMDMFLNRELGYLSTFMASRNGVWMVVCDPQGIWSYERFEPNDEALKGYLPDEDWDWDGEYYEPC